MSTLKAARAFACVLVLGISSSCTSASFTPAPSYQSSQHDRVPATSVLVLRATPPGQFLVLGDIEVQWKGAPDQDAILALVRERAAAVGANAALYLDSYAFDASDFRSSTATNDEAGPLSPTRSVRYTYQFRALRLPISSQS